ncbi:DEAD/DEAH box helicase family protein [Nonomuraea angiospora]|uniref:DEAD/DEAH box helicase family protein n=1 Tax=Nonomuraea angiospora TaxID=46172 RepID=UPI0037A65053
MVRSGDLRGAELRTEYRSDHSDVVGEFYIPALAAARQYDRAVGYFTASSLAVLSKGMDDFISRGGMMRIVASPYLEPDDIADIEAGYELRAVLERAAVRDLERAATDRRAAVGLGKLGRLVAAGRLDIKLAYVSSGNRVGMYHEKIGVFRDTDDLVAFKGSSNETLSGLVGNFESIEVFRSWDDRDAERALRISRDFEDLWQNRTQFLRVISFTDAAKVVIDRSALTSAETGNIDEIPSGGAPISIMPQGIVGLLQIPMELHVRDYQKRAVESWFAERGCGILRMATGTGKTITALAAAAQLAKVLQQGGQPLLTVVIVPYQHLVDQWSRDIEWFGVTPIRAYESTGYWHPRATNLLDALALNSVRGGVIVTTNKTFGEPHFQRLLDRYSGQLLIIADEVHNLGAKHLRDRLPSQASYRLGLSATPERWFDDAGTAVLAEYFGSTVADMGIGDAIRAGALCRYTYTPILVELDYEESELYAEVTEKVAKILGSQTFTDEPDDDTPLGALLRRRANILGHARAKIPALRREMEKRRESWHQLLYCAEGRHPLSSGEEPSQMEQVMDLVGNQLRLPAARYVAETRRTGRQEILRRFGTGDDLQVLVSMRCLDEGVDVPAARTAYLLASSSNPRQFIQRRGRVLRRAPGKDLADIIDFVVVPPEGAGTQQRTERRMVARELNRVTEFAHLAENEAETLNILRPLRIRYGLLDT